MSELVWTGSQLVALAVNGNTGTSTNGLSWTNHTQVSEAFNSITWTGTELIAVGDSGTVASSNDGISWSNKHTSVTNRAIRDFEYMGTQLVAVGGDFNYSEFFLFFQFPEHFIWIIVKTFLNNSPGRFKTGVS